MRLFHVSSSANRASILRRGLDVSQMTATKGIAGSMRPEAAGVFLCVEDWQVGYFIDMNNTGGTVDVWEVTGVSKSQLIDAGSGYMYFPGSIPPDRLTLVRRDVSSDGSSAE